MASENKTETDIQTEAETKKLPLFTPEQVSEHNSASNAWMSLYNKVYDLTEFAKDHPGGEEILIERSGTDATQDFEDIGHSDQARTILEKYIIGELNGPPIQPKPIAETHSGGGTATNMLIFAVLTCAVTVYMGMSLEMLKIGFA